MANKNIKEVEGGEATTLNDADGVESDTGSASVWIQFLNFVKEAFKRINSLTEDTSPDGTADYVVTYDASASAGKKVLLNKMRVALSAIPQGVLLNGKLSVTVASNNLTVALKNLAGNDPSAADPVYVRIQDTIRTITAALSVTKNAGTNWFNAGSNELATKEIDYFVYLGYNATDGVVIGFARIPYGAKYGDFSATSTNEAYCAISTITNAASTDYYEVIGRFAATLSAGAGYTWSVPTFTAANLINRPVYRTRSLTWVPTVTSGSGTPTTVGKTASYYIEGQYIHCQGHMLVTDKGTATGSMKLTTPFTLPDAVGYGQEVAVTGVGAAAVCSGNLIFITKYDATSPWTNTWDWYFQYHGSL